MGRKNNAGPGEHPEFGARFTKAVAESKYKDLSLAALGEKLGGVSYATVHNWAQGHKLPAIERCIIICDKLNVSMDWLLRKKGQMRPDIQGDISDYIGHLPVEDQAIIRGFIASKESSKEAKAK